MTTTAPAPSDAATEQAWLTRLLLNPGNRQVQHDIRDAADLHRRIMKLVPDGLGDSPRAHAGVLFRLDTDGAGPPVLLIQTRVAPDTGRLPAGYAQAQTRDMRTMLTSLRPGLPVRYRLLGNAVRRCGPNSTVGKWKQVIPLHGDDADQWWAARAAAAGLDLHTVLSEPADALTAWHQRDGGSGPQSPVRGRERQGEAIRVAHSATRFEGAATVRDPDALRNALLHGIGRSKSYGCGLLSLAPGGSGA
ncbi:type I-E CRISPR-associated protein Cas6/Cse3/CasE [Peterkaempfera bronchialis]|uniref:Type I-E CRISPR-associated protein Cas6/Cse3/CasE n=1 Tax=Peterkaempfera bronchialis TaxID=2126346 RepID=A0A345T1F6_9ACTN|nr:type I-E CRISPR-associated protein Cas6/Cse3/CasE [Peterkaempfera bronchialis]AXI79811.1 type I-E CRISPR-associated protein Cas6/Cse3/CasE [Peterkaempfera bronchialis]